MSASVKAIDTDHGRYLVECDGTGYDVTLETTGEKFRIDFAQDSQTWSLKTEGNVYPLMTFVDDTHVSVPLPNGGWQTIEKSQEGLMAYKAIVGQPLMASR